MLQLRTSVYRGLRFALLALLLLTGLVFVQVDSLVLAQEGTATTEPPPTPPDPFISELTISYISPTEIIILVRLQNQGETNSGIVTLTIDWKLLGTEQNGELLTGFPIGSISGSLLDRPSQFISFDIDEDLEETFKGSEGLYQINTVITVAGTDSNANNNAKLVNVPIFSKPELHISKLEFFPNPPFFSGLTDRIQVTLTVQNTGLQPLDFFPNDAPERVGVSMIICSVTTGDCQALSGIPSINVPSARGKSQEDLSIATTQMTVPLSIAGFEPGLYVLQVDIDAANSLAELDDSNQQSFPFRIIGEIETGDQGQIRHLVVGPNGIDREGTGKPGVMFFTPNDSELWALDKLRLEQWISCIGPALQGCPAEPEEGTLERQAILAALNRVVAFSSKAGKTSPFGLAKVDVLSENFIAFDQSLPTGKNVLLNRWQLPDATKINFTAQDKTRRILYAGLSNGMLWRIRFEDPETLRTLTSPESIPVEPGSQISALLAVRSTASQGSENRSAVFIGTTRDTTGNVYFLHEDQQFAQRLNSTLGRTLGSVQQITSTPPLDQWVFVATANPLENTPGSEFWWIRNNGLRQGGPTRIDENARLKLDNIIARNTFTAFAAENINATGSGLVPWLYIVSSSSQQSFLNAYEAQLRETARITNGRFTIQQTITGTKSLLSVARGSFFNRANESVLLGLVKDIALGEGDTADKRFRLLHLGNIDGEILSISTHETDVNGGFDSRTFEGRLEDQVTLDGNIQSFTVEKGVGPPGAMLLVSTDNDLSLVDERSLGNGEVLERLASKGPVKARAHSEVRPSAFSFFGDVNELIVIYASDSLYFWIGEK